MTTAVGKLQIEYFEQPETIIHDFTTYLASNANRIGYQSAIGFYRREKMDQIASDFFDLHSITPQDSRQINAWIESLSWSDIGYLVLAFNWL